MESSNSSGFASVGAAENSRRISTIWYRALRAKKMGPQKRYTMRHTFISVGLTRGVKIKWLAEYCGTSVAMIEKHYGKYLGGDSEEQLKALFGGKSATFDDSTADYERQVDE